MITPLDNVRVYPALRIIFYPLYAHNKHVSNTWHGFVNTKFVDFNPALAAFGDLTVHKISQLVR